MLRSLARLLAWVVSVTFRLAFVVAVVGLAAGFAFGGGDLPTSVDELGDDVHRLGDAAGDGIGELGRLG
ncbi:CAP domain-containing protein, partial [Halobacteriales archaeon SW_12_67_38]